VPLVFRFYSFLCVCQRVASLVRLVQDLRALFNATLHFHALLSLVAEGRQPGKASP